MHFKCVSVVVPLCCSMQGCIGFYKYHLTDVSVSVAKTGEPLSGAEVSTEYQCDLPGIINMPRAETAVTDDQGHATVSIASWKANVLVVQGGDNLVGARDRRFWVPADSLKTGADLQESVSYVDSGEVRVIISPAKHNR